MKAYTFQTLSGIWRKLAPNYNFLIKVERHPPARGLTVAMYLLNAMVIFLWRIVIYAMQKHKEFFPVAFLTMVDTFFLMVASHERKTIAFIKNM